MLCEILNFEDSRSISEEETSFRKSLTLKLQKNQKTESMGEGNSLLTNVGGLATTSSVRVAFVFFGVLPVC